MIKSVGFMLWCYHNFARSGLAMLAKQITAYFSYKITSTLLCCCTHKKPPLQNTVDNRLVVLVRHKTVFARNRSIATQHCCGSIV